METCDILPPRRDIIHHSRDSCPCLRPQGHYGEHLAYVQEFAEYIAWETDWECECETPEACEGDWCVLHREVSEEEAHAMIASKEYEGTE